MKFCITSYKIQITFPLAAAIRHMIQDPQMRAAMGAFGERRAYEFRWEHVAKQVMDYYETVQQEVNESALAPSAA